MKIFSATFLLFAASFVHSATPTWQWLDHNGRKVFSDRAPPPEIPSHRIVKRPAGMEVSPEPRYGVPSTPEAVEPKVAAPASKAVDSGVDKELEAKKKKLLEAEQAKRKAEEAKIIQAQAENCKRAKEAKATYDSGVRISRTNAAGEREVLDDAARAAEVRRLTEVMASDCK
jgi:hypothetical protein